MIKANPDGGPGSGKAMVRRALEPLGIDPDDPFLGISHDRARTIRETANSFARLNLLRGDALAELLTQVNEYARVESNAYSTYSFRGDEWRADEFLKDARAALRYCLREAGVTQYRAAETAIGRVGHCLDRIPRAYGFELQAAILSLPGSAMLTWQHFALLAQLADPGPGVLQRPQPLQRLDADRHHLHPGFREYEVAYADRREIWRMIVLEIGSVARQVIKDDMKPIALEHEVHTRLGLPTRGRPVKRKIDRDAAFTIPAIPID